MNPSAKGSARYKLDLSLSPAQTLPGHAATLTWKVVDNGARVMGVQLSMHDEGGMLMIEHTALSGSRQLIFARPGIFTFTLAATFSDGARRLRRVRVTVGGSTGDQRLIHATTAKAGRKL